MNARKDYTFELCLLVKLGDILPRNPTDHKGISAVTGKKCSDPFRKHFLTPSKQWIPGLFWLFKSPSYSCEFEILIRKSLLTETFTRGQHRVDSFVFATRSEPKSDFHYPAGYRICRIVKENPAGHQNIKFKIYVNHFQFCPRLLLACVTFRATL